MLPNHGVILHMIKDTMVRRTFHKAKLSKKLNCLSTLNIKLDGSRFTVCN